MDNFSFTPFPQILFGEGEFLKLAQKLSGNDEVLIIVGGQSLQKSGLLKPFTDALNQLEIQSSIVSIDSEPSPEMIDSVTEKFRPENIDKVIAIGGGSVLDAGKAIAAMLPLTDGITNYLEGVGTKSHPGSTVSFIAVPTTAGTGSEATKNAVISSISADGFKKSLRHDNFIPTMAIIDPKLMLSCPQELTAACGLDAITQLLESYVSSKANPITDALALGALKRVLPAFERAVTKGKEDLEARAAMAYGALISGITLANAGLGIVHGFASPIGGFFDIPHGVVCGTLLPAATETNIKKLQESSEPESLERLQKH
ncbi:MAG: iron-containing alcohol dehydrogenase [Lentisphaerales bacterium]|nr:iron-containing alcohol dehydrogenase [Lentisphaerales bacterium]